MRSYIFVRVVCLTVGGVLHGLEKWLVMASNALNGFKWL